MTRFIKYILLVFLSFHLGAQENIIIKDLIVTHRSFGKIMSESSKNLPTQTTTVQNNPMQGYFISLNFFADNLKPGHKLIVKIGNSENDGLLTNEELIVDPQVVNEKNLLVIKTNDNQRKRRSVLEGGFVSLNYFIKLADRDLAKILIVRIKDTNDLELESVSTSIKL